MHIMCECMSVYVFQAGRLSESVCDSCQKVCESFCTMSVEYSGVSVRLLVCANVLVYTRAYVSV